MPSFGHVAVGLAVARGVRAPERVHPLAWAAGLVAIADAPDLDVIAFRLGIPYGAPWGHRGAGHSLAIALLATLALALLARAARLPAGRVAAAAGLALVSHGLLDMFTDGGLGIAVLWPFTDHRFFAPWRPIPVAPIGLGVLSARGLAVILREALLFSPLLAYTLWPRRRPAPAVGAG
jgi:inner membrane protein